MPEPFSQQITENAYEIPAGYPFNHVLQAILIQKHYLKTVEWYSD
jgi:hypothetical protein